jgi:NAD(P)-dependent dehydrogenase (short-subunit alcohol dehydrogenase family)
MALQVDGKAALVTGGGSGICLEFTKILLSHGCNVLVVDLALGPEAKEIVDGKPGGKAKAVFQKTDVTNWAQLGAAFEVAIKEFGRLDIVCPGAGIFEPVSLSLYGLSIKNAPHPISYVLNLHSRGQTFGTSTLELTTCRPIPTKQSRST